MKKESEKERASIVAREKRFMRLGWVAMEYRGQLLLEVEAIKRAIGKALTGVGKQKDPICLVGKGIPVESEEFNVLLATTFNGGLPEKTVAAGIRLAYSQPEEYLQIGMEDVTKLREYLIPLIRSACPHMPEELEKVRVVTRVEIEKSK